MYTHGAFNLEDLDKMPAYLYWLLKRSVDLEVVRQRKLFISDVATAFSDPNKGVKRLERQEKQMEQMYNSLLNRQVTIDDTTTAVDWDFHDDAADKLKRWKR